MRARKPTQIQKEVYAAMEGGPLVDGFIEGYAKKVSKATIEGLVSRGMITRDTPHGTTYTRVTREPTQDTREPAQDTREPVQGTREPTQGTREPTQDTSGPLNLSDVQAEVYAAMKGAPLIDGYIARYRTPVVACIGGKSHHVGFHYKRVSKATIEALVSRGLIARETPQGETYTRCIPYQWGDTSGPPNLSEVQGAYFPPVTGLQEYPRESTQDTREPTQDTRDTREPTPRGPRQTLRDKEHVGRTFSGMVKRGARAHGLQRLLAENLYKVPPFRLRYSEGALVYSKSTCQLMKHSLSVHPMDEYLWRSIQEYSSMVGAVDAKRKPLVSSPDFDLQDAIGVFIANSPSIMDANPHLARAINHGKVPLTGSNETSDILDFPFEFLEFRLKGERFVVLSINLNGINGECRTLPRLFKVTQGFFFSYATAQVACSNRACGSAYVMAPPSRSWKVKKKGSGTPPTGETLESMIHKPVHARTELETRVLCHALDGVVFCPNCSRALVHNLDVGAYKRYRS